MISIAQPKASITVTMTKRQAAILADFLRRAENVNVFAVYEIMPVAMRQETIKSVVSTLDDLLSQDEEDHLLVRS